MALLPTRTLPRSAPKLAWWLRFVLAVAGGLSACWAWPTNGLWPVIFLSLPLLWLSIRGLGFWAAFGIGLVGGFCFYCAQLPWLSFYLGPEPWLALSLLEALIFALGFAMTASVWRMLVFRGWLTQALALAALWSTREWCSTHFPYGGFPWSTLAQTQSESPLANWAYWGGLDLLSFVVAFLSALLMFASLALFRTFSRKPGVSSVLWSRQNLIGLAVAAVCLVVPLATHPATGAEAGTLTFAAVQGNANAGLFSNSVPGEILDKHVAATGQLAGILKKRGPDAARPQVIIWPENSADLSPLSFQAAASKVKHVVETNRLPLILGTYRFDESNRVFNTSLYYDAKGNLVSHYDKQRPVPFAEYVPDRDFWYSIAPDLIGLISHGYTAGNRDGIFKVDGARLGIEICFEVAIPEISQNVVSKGAQVLVVQTNSADFGHSAEMYQQAAFAKLRAIETGRALIGISTVGISAVYAPDGSEISKLPTFEPGVMVESVPLRNSHTPAFLLNLPIVMLLNTASFLAFTLALLLAASGNLARRKKRATATESNT